MHRPFFFFLVFFLSRFLCEALDVLELTETHLLLKVCATTTWIMHRLLILRITGVHH